MVTTYNFTQFLNRNSEIFSLIDFCSSESILGVDFSETQDYLSYYNLGKKKLSNLLKIGKSYSNIQQTLKFKIIGHSNVMEWDYEIELMGQQDVRIARVDTDDFDGPRIVIGGSAGYLATVIYLNELLNENGFVVYSNKRVKSSIGKALKKIDPKASDEHIEKATNIIKTNWIEPNFEILPASRIYDVYMKANNSADSCMTYKERELFKIFEDNEEVVSILILQKENGYILGRALLWTTEDGIVMDRVYSVNDSINEKFHSYAKERGWFRRYNTDWSNIKILDKDNCYTQREQLFKIPIKNDPDLYPYLDTFDTLIVEAGEWKLMRFDDAVELCRKDKTTRGFSRLRSTSGGPSHEGRFIYEEEISNIYIQEEN